MDGCLIGRIHELIKKKKNSIPNKTVLQEGLKDLEFFANETNLSKSILLKDFIETYLKSISKKTESNAGINNKQLINKKKKEYQKRENEGSELVVNTAGSFIGKSSHGIVIKIKGQIISKKPTTALKHITITGEGVSISGSAIQYCMEHKISVDFMDGKGKHYASLLPPISLDIILWQKQALLPLANKIELGSRIIYGKLKNQENLIKYYHKYHKDAKDSVKILTERYPELILRIDECIQRVKTYTSENESYATQLMGQEAVAAVAYWEYIRLLLANDKVDFHSREHQGATDLVNSMLNYGYAILYARVWNSVLIHKMNPTAGVLHAPQPGKPTFVYDLVELFRAQAVDRVVISLIQKGESLKMKNNLLSESTKCLLLQHVLERLNRYEKYRGEELSLIEIINRQVHEVSKYILGESKTFKPYIAKW